ncbi:hypothetical protein ACFCWG_41305 [Streptomyces sp. NPDC056390]|uniref:hypothetical protein n=1 Tax=Streptomyces sp. NPDC056390 TaxID=3345806 RepID=UPI0035DAC381
MAHTFDELVERQQAANAAHREVLRLRDEYGPPTAAGWAETQTATYETAWRAWRDLARDTQAAVTQYAKEQGITRHEAEADVKAKARADEAHPEP